MSLRAGVVACVAAGLLVPASPAHAACHAFTISASPAAVDEGGSVTVTVERDGDVGPSSVRVRTVDGTARAGADYVGVTDRTVTFASGVTQTFPVGTTNDSTKEGAETFRVELIEGSGSGCAPNPNFVYGPPATVTIKANDQPLPTTPPVTTPPTRSASPTASRSPLPQVSSRPPGATSAPPASPTGTTSPVPLTTSPAQKTSSAAPTESPSPTDSETPGGLAERSGSGGGLPVVPIALGGLVVAALLGFAGFRLLRAR